MHGPLRENTRGRGSCQNTRGNCALYRDLLPSAEAGIRSDVNRRVEEMDEIEIGSLTQEFMAPRILARGGGGGG